MCAQTTKVVHLADRRLKTDTESVESRIVLQGLHVRLEPLELSHAEALAAAAASGDGGLYQWSPVPQTAAAARKYVETALAWREDGTAVPFAIVRLSDHQIVGSSRFFNIERWPWNESHERHGRRYPDACEIGYTWYASSAIRTAVNTESKLLMLTHAFENWEVFRVCFHTDARNLRSRTALERIGAKFEGILRAHRMAADFVPRDSYRYNIVAEDWPQVKAGLQAKLAH